MFSILVFLFAAMWSDTFAQDRFPEFLLTDDFEEPQISNNQNDNVTIVLKNPLMRDVIYLQEQINLLEALVQRQAEIQKIATNYEQIGVPYKQPPPPANVCRKLPPNVLCIYFYPDMDSNRVFLSETRSRVRERQNMAVMQSLEDYSYTQPQSAQSEPTEILPIQTAVYKWTDIECRLGNCTALITSSDNSDNRIRVKNGDKIDGDRLRIVSINPVGVIASIQGNEFTLQPASLAGNDYSPAPQSNDVSSILAETLMDDGNMNIQGQTQSSSSMSQNEPAVPAPMLGPTGLF